MKSFMFALFAGVGMTFAANASIAASTFVNTQVSSRVDTASSAKQTLSGTYKVADTAVFEVPTPSLPSAS